MSSPPDPSGGLVAALEALRRDARTWHDASHALAAPTEAVRGLAVPPPAFSFLGEAKGLPVLYEALRMTAERLLGQAAEVTGHLGDTLEAAAATYEREDRENAHLIAGQPGG